MNDKKVDLKLGIIENELCNLKYQNDDLKDSFDLIKQILIKSNEKLLKTQNYCPICGVLSEFESYGIIPRNNAKCTNCGSLERHRLVYLLLKEYFSTYFRNKDINVLHFAPEHLFYKFFNENDNVDYFPVDIDPERYNDSKMIKIRYKVDMQSIPFTNDKFDLILNSHVLEHVPDDIKAMGELYRVLKSDGICLILVPYYNLPETFENDKYNTPKLRLKYFGQEDHFRKYGLDFKDRLESVGFKVEEIRGYNIANESDRKLYGLAGDVIFVCRK